MSLKIYINSQLKLIPFIILTNIIRRIRLCNITLLDLYNLKYDLYMSIIDYRILRCLSLKYVSIKLKWTV